MLSHALAGLLLAAALPMAAARAADDAADRRVPGAAPDLQADQDQALEKRRARIIQDAVAVLEATQQAIEALEAKDAGRALTQLEIAAGKLDLLVSRHPDAAVLPIEVTVSEVDVVASDAAIREIVERAEEALEDGRVQLARRLLAPLGSELVFSTTELPLAAYPAAMRLAAPLIEAEKFEEAREALLAALDTLIVRDEVVPLPVLRAEALIALAEEQLNEPSAVDPSQPETPGAPPGEEEGGPSVAELLADARRQLERASVLGYGEARKTYPDLVARLEKLEKSLGNEPSPGWRDRLSRLRATLEEYGSSLLD